MIPTGLLDFVRKALTLWSTVYVVAWVGHWHWIGAVVAALPVFFVMLNLWGFLTLPLYIFSPEVRQARQAEKDLWVMARAGRHQVRGGVK
jgi:hypothetical protein